MEMSTSTTSNQKQPTSLIGEFIGGAVGGMAGIFFGFPLDSLKTRMQFYQNSTDHSQFKQSFHSKYDYIRGLYRGLAPPLICEILNNFFLFGIYGALKSYQNQYSKEKCGQNYRLWREYGAMGLSGLFSGACISAIVQPFEIVKVQMQIAKGQEKVSFIQGMKQLYHKNKLFHGFTSCTIHQMAFFSIYFPVYEYCKRTMYEKQYSDAVVLLISGGIAGTLGWMISYPSDTAKTIVQSSYEMNLRKVWKQYSIANLYRGFFTTAIRAFPVNSVTFYTYELVMRYFPASLVYAREEEGEDIPNE